MLRRLNGKIEPASLATDGAGVPRQEAISEFLSVEDFKNAAVLRLNALKAAYLQQLETTGKEHVE